SVCSISLHDALPILARAAPRAMRRQKDGRHLFSILHVKAKPMPARTTHTCTNQHGRRVLIRPTGDKRVRFLIRSADDFYTAQPITVRTGECGEQGGRLSMGIEASTALNGVVETRAGDRFTV